MKVTLFEISYKEKNELFHHIQYFSMYLIWCVWFIITVVGLLYGVLKFIMVVEQLSCPPSAGSVAVSLPSTEL